MIKKLDFFLNFYNKEEHVFDFIFYNKNKIIDRYEPTNFEITINNKKFFYFDFQKYFIYFYCENKEYLFK